MFRLINHLTVRHEKIKVNDLDQEQKDKTKKHSLKEPFLIEHATIEAERLRIIKR